MRAEALISPPGLPNSGAWMWGAPGGFTQPIDFPVLEEVVRTVQSAPFSPDGRNLLAEQLRVLAAQAQEWLVSNYKHLLNE